jgi:Cadherin-like
MNSRLPSPSGMSQFLLLSAITVVMTTAQTDLPLRSPRSATDLTSRRPRFDLPLRYRIVEELPVGTAIADLAVDAGLKRKYGPDVLGELEYRLLQDPAPVPLAIGLRTGLLTTVGRIDRDELASCRDKTTCELTVDVTVRPARYFQVVKVKYFASNAII